MDSKDLTNEVLSLHPRPFLDSIRPFSPVPSRPFAAFYSAAVPVQRTAQIEVFLEGRSPHFNHSGRILIDYSLQRAFDFKATNDSLSKGNDSDTSIYLTPDLCQVGSDGLYDCFKACNQTAMFSSMPKLHNCMVGVVLSNFGTILDVTKVFLRSEDEPELPSTQESTDMISMSMMTHVAAERTSEIMLECVSAGVRDFRRMQNPATSEINSSIDELGTRIRPSGEMHNLSDINLTDLCSLVPGHVNQDVGGIGVSCLRTAQRSSLY